VGAAVASRQKWDSSVFWAMTKIWAEELFGVSNIALIHIERAPTNVQWSTEHSANTESSI